MVLHLIDVRPDTEGLVEKWQLTVRLPNGDDIWTNLIAADFHHAATLGIQFADSGGGRLVRIEKVMLRP